MKRLILLALSLLFLGGSACASSPVSQQNLDGIVAPYTFSLWKWELGVLWDRLKPSFGWRKEQGIGASVLAEYFRLLHHRDCPNSGSPPEPGGEERIAQLEERAERSLERLMKEALLKEGIRNPLENYLSLPFFFPPVDLELGSPPNLLATSPRDRIALADRVLVVPVLSLEEIESLEAQVDALGVSSLVVELGGLGASFPSMVSPQGGLRPTLETALEEWLHQYLTFTPLGASYVLGLVGVRADPDLATLNETLAGMVARELADRIYEDYFSGVAEVCGAPPEREMSEEDFRREMKRIRLKVEEDLAEGKIQEAEAFMEERRVYLASKGYYIRKLNQAYFAFHGTYADSPASISPIYAELTQLRARSQSLKDFLGAVARMTSHEDLKREIGASP